MHTRGCSKVWSCSGARSDNGGFGGGEIEKLRAGEFETGRSLLRGVETRRAFLPEIETGRALLLKRLSRPGGLSYGEREENA